MISASQLCHRVCGSPVIDDCLDHAEEPCAICGGCSSSGVPIAAFIGPTMTDQASFRAPHGAHACAACAFVRARFSPVPGKPAAPGKSEGPRWSNFSHLYDDGTHVPASKGEKPRILAFLRGPKIGAWFAAIADSGQKHVLPYTPVNPAGARRGRVRFEERNVTLPDAAGWAIVEDAAALLTAGATKDEIARGEYGQRAWSLCRSPIEAFEGAHGRLRGGDWFALALWLSQRDEADVAARIAAEKEAKRGSGKRRAKGAAADAAGGDAAGDPERVPASGSEPAEALGPAAEQSPVSGAASVDSGRVGHDAVPWLAAADAEQLGLFGAVGPEPRGAGRRAARDARRGGARPGAAAGDGSEDR